jgi:hypothetical protein
MVHDHAAEFQAVKLGESGQVERNAGVLNPPTLIIEPLRPSLRTHPRDSQ